MAAVQREPRLRCWAEIDMAALERNLRRIRSALPQAVRYVAVVKADAYGHGLQRTAARLMQSGVDMFAVANVDEAAGLRELGSGWPVLVLSALLPGEESALIDHQLTATVSTPNELERFEAAGAAAGKTVPVHLKVDTGMGRLGVWHGEAGKLYAAIRAARHVELAGIFTHYSAADSDAGFTGIQRGRFLDFLATLPAGELDGLMIHADNSASLESFTTGSPFNAVRVGLLQFGVPPYPDSLLGKVEVEPVLGFYSRIGITKTLPAGTDISYGRTFRLERATRIAVLTAGYGDGVPLSLSNRGEVLIEGVRCPILGRVTMDQTVVDASGVPHSGPGDEVVLIGRSGGSEIGAAEFSAAADTIPWEVLTSITKRVPRLYTAARET